MDWRNIIVCRLQTRNQDECLCYEELITNHNRLFETFLALKNENFQLSIQNEKLRTENITKGGSGGGDSASSERILILEQKLLSQQEELTELHKRRGENAQMLVDLNTLLQEKEKLLAAKDESLAQNAILINSLRAEVNMYEVNERELKSLNQVLKDEHQALQLAFTHLEEKLRKAQDDNREMVERLVKYKNKDAEKMNEENENFVRHKNLKLQKELEDAAKDMLGLQFDMPPPLVSNVMDLPTNPSVSFTAHDGEVNAIRWSPVDKLVATGGSDRKVKLWDVSKGLQESRGLLTGSNKGVMSVEFDSTGGSILGASNDQACRVWTTSDQRLRHSLTGHSNKVLAAKFLGEATKVVSGSYDRVLKIWDLRSRACIDTKFAGSSCNDLVSADSLGSAIISGHVDKKIRFWDKRTEAMNKSIEVQGKVTSLDLSRDYKYLLACVRDDTLRLIDLRMDQVLHTFFADGFKVACDWTRAIFNREDNYVTVGSSDGSIFIWDVKTERVEVVLSDAHNNAVTAVAWSPFSNFLASADRSGKVVVWTST